LINLLRNSTKFTFKGYIQLSLRLAKLVIVQDRKPVAYQDAVQFEVFDTGIGISKQNQENLFKLFGKVM
jgi:signal transduction histidine kinase